MSALKRAIIIVADGVGCGGAPDAADYGDVGADTPGNLARVVGGLALPHLRPLLEQGAVAITGRGSGAVRVALGGGH
jgi:phosphopentomutase